MVAWGTKHGTEEVLPTHDVGVLAHSPLEGRRREDAGCGGEPTQGVAGAGQRTQEPLSCVDAEGRSLCVGPEQGTSPVLQLVYPWFTCAVAVSVKAGQLGIDGFNPHAALSELAASSDET